MSSDLKKVRWTCLSNRVFVHLASHARLPLSALGRPPAPASEHGKAVKIVSFAHDNVTVDDDALKSVLDVYGVRNLPVVMVSVAGEQERRGREEKREMNTAYHGTLRLGPFRTGKSFLLNFFIRYLREPVSRAGHTAGP